MDGLPDARRRKPACTLAPPLAQIVDGARQFQQAVTPEARAFFAKLAAGQAPKALFVTCSDSRINPFLITDASPGDLFIMRNAGHIVPPFGAARGGAEATVEFAVVGLGVEDVIVCGHSHCGAIRGLLYPETVAAMPAVAHWLSLAEPTRAIVRDNYGNLPERERVEVATQVHVLTQMDNLRTLPCVASRLARGALRLHGWVYHIGSSEILAWSEPQGRFVRLDGAEPLHYCPPLRPATPPLRRRRNRPGPPTPP